MYVRSRRAGERVLAGLQKLYDRLRLKFNDAKTAVAPASQRKFLGYAFWYGSGGQVKCRVADKALTTFKQRIRQLTRRSGGRSLPEIAERLRAYMPGWKAYFQLAQTPKVFRELDEWIRHRLREVQLKHWCRTELLAIGANEQCCGQNRVHQFCAFLLMVLAGAAGTIFRDACRPFAKLAALTGCVSRCAPTPSRTAQTCFTSLPSPGRSSQDGCPLVRETRGPRV